MMVFSKIHLLQPLAIIPSFKYISLCLLKSVTLITLMNRIIASYHFFDGNKGIKEQLNSFYQCGVSPKYCNNSLYNCRNWITRFYIRTQVILLDPPWKLIANI